MGTINLTDALPQDKALLDSWTTALIDARLVLEKGTANGIAPLGADGIVPSQYLPTVSLTWGSITGLLSDQTDLLTALGAKASTSSPAFSGVPTAPTPDLYDSSLQIANTAFVKSMVSSIGWKELGVLTASDAGNTDDYGSSVSLSRDGTVLAVGATEWDGVGTNEGKVYTYDWNGTQWVERATIVEGLASDAFGRGVALNSDGTILVVGASWYDNTVTWSGCVYTYDWNGSSWVQRGSRLLASDAGDSDEYGCSVVLNSAGTVMAVGALAHDGTYTDEGAVYIYDWNGSVWVQRGGVMLPPYPQASENFGSCVAFNDDASTLIVGASGYDGTGGTNEGRAYRYIWSGSAWTLKTTLYPPTRQAYAYFGWACSTNSDGLTLAISSKQYAGNNSAEGIVWVGDYVYNEYFWRTKTVRPSEVKQQQHFGSGCAISADASRIAVGEINYEYQQTNLIPGGVRYGLLEQ